MSEDLLRFQPPAVTELAPDRPVDVASVRSPSYGKYIEEFVEGTTFKHPREFTLFPSFVQEFATTFLETNPIYLSEPFAQAHGYRTLPATPLMVLTLGLSLSVQTDSEKAVANLGYYHVRFVRPVYAGDTLHGESTVLSRRLRGAGKPGVVRVRTRTFNQADELVLQYERTIMIRSHGGPAVEGGAPPPPPEPPELLIPRAHGPYPAGRTGETTYFEDFEVGDIIAHANGRTISEEHFAWTYRLGNTHPLHYDRIYSGGQEGPMSGEPIVAGPYVFAWLVGLASRDTTENSLWELGFHEGYHTQPSVAGDTVYAMSRVIDKQEGPAGLDAGIVTIQLLGVKNIRGIDAIERYGADLFVKESSKAAAGRPKIPEKIFEIERQVLIKRRP
ncbi:MAG TPA: MaoC family dehydratase [Dehalococcoidia bacterium]|nr:MaoC family dehydratase [Dehalococcoidia bacterium]